MYYDTKPMYPLHAKQCYLKDKYNTSAIVLPSEANKLFLHHAHPCLSTPRPCLCISDIVTLLLTLKSNYRLNLTRKHLSSNQRSHQKDVISPTKRSTLSLKKLSSPPSTPSLIRHKSFHQTNICHACLQTRLSSTPYLADTTLNHNPP